MKEIECVVKVLPKGNSPDPSDFTSVFLYIFKK